ncbi:MAG: hypothetical protein H7Y03_00700 [Chitinophagaceae bacterium]|nr:hypothetical protein [Chitinophagaceae bacterium]
MGLATTALRAQPVQADSTALPGDNFSLEGALEMFKKASSPEAFEQLLNKEENSVNNLDLDEDGNTDYIRVVNKKQGDVQVFILQVSVSEKESQDVAVIELEKNGPEKAILQITGDEDLYGEETIVEPTDEAAASETSLNASPQRGPYDNTGEYNTFSSQAGIIVNVWGWPCVRFVYAPAYTVWVSPWGWARRPVWFRPWRPLGWAAFRPVRYRYHHHYAVVHTRRVVRARPIYRPVRVTSVTVRTRNQVAVNNYRTTRRTQTRTVTAPSGRRYQATRRTTTVQGANGRNASRTTTTVRKKRS